MGGRKKGKARVCIPAICSSLGRGAQLPRLVCPGTTLANWMAFAPRPVEVVYWLARGGTRVGVGGV